jgi:heme oxygenase (biliverdin-IX-beta and delta-forming)
MMDARSPAGDARHRLMNHSVTEDSLLGRIRRETRELHERLETELNFPAPGLTLSRYRGVLGGFYGFYAPWEERLEPWLPQLRGEGAQLRPKLPDLLSDLTFFQIDRCNLPHCRSVPECRTLPEAIGSLYVREGSALGGQYISRQLQSLIGLSGGSGYQFFSSAGQNVGGEWKRFQSVLLSYSSPENDEAIVESARQTFDAIRVWLCESR